MGDSIFSRIRNIFRNNNIRNNNQDNQEPIAERYGVAEENIQWQNAFEEEEGEGVVNENPLYGTNDGPVANLLENIGGLPTVESIQKMVPDLKLGKLRLFKDFTRALDALEEYQTLVKKPHFLFVNDVEMRRNNKLYSIPKVNLYAEALTEDHLSEAEKVYLKMADFIHWTEKAVDGSRGFFARRSDNVRRISPVFANMLVQAYNLLPKLAHLETAVPPYLIATDREVYNFSDVIDHAVTAGRSGGLAMHGFGNENSQIMLSPEKASEAAQSARQAGKLKESGENADIYEDMMELRNDATKKARMNLKIPMLQTGDQGQGAVKRVDSYLTELKKLMVALEDTAESAEFSVEEDGKLQERKGVQNMGAINFRLSRLLYLVTQHRDTLEAIVTNAENAAQMPGYEEIEQLRQIAGNTLSDAAKDLNDIAMEEANYARLEDENGNELQFNKDYKVGGGGTSVAILDFKNKRVFRAPKNFTKEQQTTALNGIKDEASGVVSRFLGFNVCAQAKAAGFVSRDRNGENPTPLFGGSIMEMAKGKVAAEINLLLRPEDQESMNQERKGFQNLDVMKQGRLIGDIMKLNVLDYIIMHDDRHWNNFLVNLDADETESMVTGIDNDYVLGSKNGRHNGADRSADTLAVRNDNVAMDNGVTLEGAFPMMTPEVKAALQNLDLAALNQLLMPYCDRAVRMVVIHRASSLKKHAETVETCDLTTQEGTEMFVNKSIRSSMAEWVRETNIVTNGSGMHTREMPNTLVRLILQSHYGADYNDHQKMIQKMKFLGLSKAEVEKILLENLSSSKTADVKVTMEEIMASDFGKALENY